jgi:mRNA-degrading endonuclease RelE of RelBE toxin-antitoxin system
MELVWSCRASKGMATLPTKARAAMTDRLKAIAADPFARHANVEPLKGERNAFRVRQGDWRAVSLVDRAAGLIRVVTVAARRGVCR